ncbi:DUF5818 domain-containing protein [Flavisphingomonas formosensis]|uniref:DUF5818 domain-containing protein n=1 Tax=Flavisphingomonas formosensis TaxID=861534 RepID=UPI0012FA5A1D
MRRPHVVQHRAVTDNDSVDETGMLLRQGAGFVLRRDLGGILMLELHRVPVDLVAKRVRLVGRRLADGHVEVEGVQPWS